MPAPTRAPPRSTSQEHLPGAPPKGTSQGHLPGAPPRSTSQEHLPGAPPRSTSQGHLPGAPTWRGMNGVRVSWKSWVVNVCRHRSASVMDRVRRRSHSCDIEFTPSIKGGGHDTKFLSQRASSCAQQVRMQESTDEHKCRCTWTRAHGRTTAHKGAWAAP